MEQDVFVSFQNICLREKKGNKDPREMLGDFLVPLLFVLSFFTLTRFSASKNPILFAFTNF